MDKEGDTEIGCMIIWFAIVSLVLITLMIIYTGYE